MAEVTYPRGTARHHAPRVGLALALLLGACGAEAGTDAAPPPPSSTTPVVAVDDGDPATPEPPTPPPTTGPTTAPPTTAPPPEVVRTLAFGGDLLTHMPLVAEAQRDGAAAGAPYDFGPMLAPLAPIVGGADLALCHLEVPLVGDGQQVTGYPSFHAPRELAGAVAGAGYDGCSTASNHSLDGGRPAIDATLGTFDALGLGHVGTARSPEEDVAPRLYSLDGVVVAHLSYAYGFNGYQPPADAPWIVDALDPAVVARDAAAARAAGAQLVVVSVHWGTEYQHEPDAYQRDMAAAVTAIAEVDLVVGHHAHVVQPIERVGDTWVVFGLGNQLSNQSQDVRRDGLTVVVTVAGPAGGPLAVRTIEAVPTFVDLGTYEVLPTAATLARPDLDPGLRAALEASQARTMGVVNRSGAGIALRP
ncbi:CapA family protein [Iamia sp. SCSIO 61187]|uniref:CapA family protein n=1 Tax=Iamia sp. SCSIO 61187 TaxID=2722752 RepID=UPI001C628439|nr:CapA family protein [Iamia sp. SCSIO 61187]QYG93291.1 CapA family protein [Iamia sp. SCSIO 61187]